VEILRETCIVPDIAPVKLYHYTDLDGLMGILNTGQLWATDVKFMNDMSEYDHANEMIKTELSAMETEVLPLFDPPLPVNEGIITAAGAFLRQSKRRAEVIEMAEHLILYQKGYRCYVSCFCDSGDLLRQWRAYASGGYSIEFDGSVLSSRYQGKILRS
jgi:hypothetical protein